jgi:hypothetical protein
MCIYLYLTSEPALAYGIGRWFSLSSLVTSTNKTDSNDIAEKFLKVALNTIHQTKQELPYAKAGSLVRYKYM